MNPDALERVNPSEDCEMTDRQTQRAIAFASRVHAGQTGKDGRRFVEHLRRVASRVPSGQARTVAWLHDVVEKTPVPGPAELLREGFGEDVARAVDAMTRREGEDYFDHARRAAADPLALPVKIADLEDHVETGWKRGQPVEKYLRALEIVRGARGG